ncbi:SDR family NAD(P)-dependent oxidoreductase [Pectobacterium carotovorum subsp. carotovorum]|nr:SDR family NAD(P)-dependent oxidoreductase [Pectobacterium carotovorum]MCL6335822.1 SDR family NAD(P)-dependent oxidoreductase [Pectobacterium carotovorum subsp. carotovorum]MCL6348840.1 SDR family NAD(P)-dependent oxidoreductase [Pectobacterium carotovorum subsp. carotovorum]MCL6403303.1 SDR family NAD(P)-dependent oxidoreductase [Pectobacterium carotovorum subsp. carotovorum]
MNDTIIAKGRTAVITGAAKGLGAAAARRLAAEGMRLSLFDRDAEALKVLVASLGSDVDAICVLGDVTVENDLKRLQERTFTQFGEVALLMNNAAIKEGASPWGKPCDWFLQLNANLFSIITMQHLFVPSMMAQEGRSAIVNLGSKEGITTPPGNAAYSVAKAGVKVLTEQLAHELRNHVGEKVTAHLLVPGYTWTPMNFPSMDETTDSQPSAAWSANQVIDYFIEHFRQGDFYIICPDNEVTTAMDKKRIAWASQDILNNRPALSRWHPEWKMAFEEWMAS